MACSTARRALTVAAISWTLAGAAAPIDVDAFWEYGDPAASEVRFRNALPQADADQRLELLTQIARTYGLRGDFRRAHALLDEVEAQLPAATTAAPRVRVLLERGRTVNSAGDAEGARRLFERAWEAAREARLEGLAVDAAHMMAITWSGQPQAIDWNERGLALARDSADAKARALIPAMLNNIAWDLHDLRRYAEALPRFREALAAWSERGKPEQIRFARYAVGRCLRLLKRTDEALAAQRALEADYAAAGETNGYVFEEIAELLDSLGRGAEATPYFRRAAEALAEDEWLRTHEPQRLAHLRERGGQPSRDGMR